MRKRYALNFGLSDVDDKHYGEGLDVRFGSGSASYMATALGELGYTSKVWVDEKATSSRMLNEISNLANQLVEGDSLVLTFCGHMISIVRDWDLPNAQNEDMGWVMFDRVLFHFELWNLVQKFKPGVRIIVISDSCNTGDFGFSRNVRISPVAKTHKKETKEDDSGLPQCFVKFKLAYNLILRDSVDPSQYKVPPAIVIIGSTSRIHSTHPDSDNNHRTDFSLMFQFAFEHVGSSKTLSWKSLHDEIIWQTVHQEIWSDARREANEPNPTVSAIKNSVDPQYNVTRLPLPQWHYYRGYEYTLIDSEYIGK